VTRGAPPPPAARAARAAPAGGRSLQALLGDLRTLVVEEPAWRRVDPDGRSFVDLDEPADLAAWDPGPRQGAPDTARSRRVRHGPVERAHRVPGAGPLPARAEPAGRNPRRDRGHPGACPGGRPHLPD